MNVLIKFSHGLGDAVQLTVVLKHLRRYRPDWTIDVFALIGKHSAVRHLCRHVYHDQEGRPAESTYDSVFDLPWWENYNGYTDRPNTKVTNCLHEIFGLHYDQELGNYDISPLPEDFAAVDGYLRSIGCVDVNGKFNTVIIHHMGNTSPGRKNLNDNDILPLIDWCMQHKLVPIILDWDNRSKLSDQSKIFSPRPGFGDVWGGTGTGDAARIAAMVARSQLFVGVDSGPQKCAAATTTTSIGVWTKHLPLQFVDITPHMVHLVPATWRDIPPCAGCPERCALASKLYKQYEYADRNNLAIAIRDLAASLTGKPVKQMSHVNPDWTNMHGFWVRLSQLDQDLTIVRDVYLEDSYRTRLYGPDRGPEVVVDVGAHIGCFAKLWHMKNPQAKIICVEACPENIPLLRANVGDFALIIPAACTYETGELGLMNAIHDYCASTGGSIVVPIAELDNLENSNYRQAGYVYWADRRTLRKITLEEIMAEAGVDHIDLLKLDCEGSEISILGKTPSLDKIRFVFGEWHDRYAWDNLLSNRFRDGAWDYGIMYDDHGSGRGIFHLARKKWPVTTAIPVTTTQAPTVLLTNSDAMRIAIPSGLGDALWVLTKLPDFLAKNKTNKADLLICAGSSPPELANRSVECLRRFDFINSVEVCDLNIVESNQSTLIDGGWNYAPSQPNWHGRVQWLLQANGHLESGKLLSDWLPEIALDWHIMRYFKFTNEELDYARGFAAGIGRPFLVFYYGPLDGNTIAGHNRGPRWPADNWCKLANYLAPVPIVSIGASWDRSYFESEIARLPFHNLDCLGKWTLPQTLAIIKHSAGLVGYQSGLGVAATYMGVRAAMFWRAYGDSILPDAFVSFNEQMASAWVDPAAVATKRYLPLIYGKCSPESVADLIKSEWKGLYG